MVSLQQPGPLILIFFWKGKQVAWAAFVKASDATLAALAKLQEGQMDAESLKAVLLFISQIYKYDCPLPQSRWIALQKQKVQPALAPPTESAATQHILRAQLQALVWERALEPSLVMLSPTDYGYNDDYSPIPSSLPPAPQSVLVVIRCGCKAICDTDRCRCQGMSCSELCECSTDKCLNDDPKHETVSDEYDDM